MGVAAVRLSPKPQTDGGGGSPAQPQTTDQQRDHETLGVAAVQLSPKAHDTSAAAPVHPGLPRPRKFFSLILTLRSSSERCGVGGQLIKEAG